MLSGRSPHSRLPGKALARLLGNYPIRTALTAACFVLAVFACLGHGHAALAQGVTSNEILPTGIGTALGASTTDIRITIANIIRIALGFLGTLALLIILYAGFVWMTAGGDEEKVTRAKKTLTSAVIGLIIILAAFGITSFIISRLLGQVGGPGGGSTSGALDDAACIGLSATCPAGALGNGIIESHYPARNATGVPRNTRIAITFKQEIDPASLVVGGGVTSTVAIIPSTEMVGSGRTFQDKFGASLKPEAIDVASAGDGKTFVFMQKNCPTDCFGSPSKDVFYTVGLRGGADGVKKKDGTAAFAGTFSSGYAWEFQVSTVLDTTPPKVSYVEPTDKESDVARNSIVQINFNEAVDPVSLNTGLSIKGDTIVLRGTQLFGNAYRSLEFRTDDPCGVNSCGETVYCLPKNSDIAVTVKADDVITAPLGKYPPNGVTDMCGNSLDGNGDGIAQGQSTDNYAFEFTTDDQIDLVPPKVVTQNPVAQTGGIGNIPRDALIDATFNKLMSATPPSMTSDSMRLVPPANDGAPTNFSVTSEGLPSVVGGKLDQTKASIRHDLLSVNSQKYAADMTSGLRDLHQNCFFPGGGQTVCTGNEPYCCNGTPYSSVAAATAACGFAP